MNFDNERLRLVQREKIEVSKKLLKEDNPIKEKMLQNKLLRLREVEQDLLDSLGD